MPIFRANHGRSLRVMGLVELVGVKTSFWPTWVRRRVLTVEFLTRKPTEMPVPSWV
jgi:hypothetical protein